VPRVVLLLSMTAVVLGAGAVYAATRQPARPVSRGAARPHRAHSAAAPAGPLRVLSVWPAAGARGFDGSDPVRVTFSVPLARDSPLPELAPAVGGRWQRTGPATVAFTAAPALAPLTSVRVIIPAGPRGVRSAAGRLLPGRVVTGFRTGTWQPLRFEQLLAQLGYLPVSWAPALHGLMAGGTGSPAAADAAAQLSGACDPPAGTFSWQAGYPASPTRPGTPGAGEDSLILRGAVMAFQAGHGLAMDGVIGPVAWQAMLRAVAAGQDNAHGCTYALARKASPEALTIWHDGQVVFRHLANTGIPAAPAAGETYPVYLRYQFQVMRGVNPDGSHYADPVAFVAYFNGGDAVHYFPRASCGSPQSLGCVELPRAAAECAWRYVTYGSLVTVTG